MYALITGASSGIGKEFAKKLARLGYDLILVARRSDRLDKLKRQLEQKYNCQVVTIPADLSKQDNCYKVFQQCLPYDIEILINNAGFGKVGKFAEIPIQDEIDMIQTNILALHILTKLFVQHMDTGYILNVSSIAAFQSTPMMATYGATKAYVLSLGRAINYEMKKIKKEVFISTLCPEPVNTEFNKVADADFNLKSISPSRCAAIGLKGMFAKKQVIIPGTDIKLLQAGSKILPNKLLLPIEYWIQNRKI